MITVAQTVADILLQDDIALAALQKGWLNYSSYARSIQPKIQARLLKEIQLNAIITAVSRLANHQLAKSKTPEDFVQGLVVHAKLEGLTYERSEKLSVQIGEIYNNFRSDSKTFLTVTQGINEVTIIAESKAAQYFRNLLSDSQKVYDKKDLVGVTVKFKPGNLENPNLIYASVRRLAYKNINVIEIVSTATELTFLIHQNDLSIVLEQLQKDI